jgi:hypothetical protein
MYPNRAVTIIFLLGGKRNETIKNYRKGFFDSIVVRSYTNNFGGLISNSWNRIADYRYCGNHFLPNPCDWNCDWSLRKEIRLGRYMRSFLFLYFLLRRNFK